MSKKTPLPTLRRRVLASGREQFYSRFGDKQLAFGTDEQQARREFAEMLRSWEAHGQRLPVDVAGAPALTIADLVRAYVQHADGYYRRPDGTPTNEARNTRDAVGGDGVGVRKPESLLGMYGEERASDFGPVKLAHVRERMIAAGLARVTINSRVHRIRRAFRWAASREMVGGSVVQSLAALDGLRLGRSAARETEPIRPVLLEDVEATVAHLSRQVAAMVWLQWWSGMRPGEVVAMRPCDIDTSGDVWTYRPQRHKTQHCGRERTIDLGPRAQDVLRPFLQRVPRPRQDAPVFRPDDAEAERNRDRRGRRGSPMTPSQARRAKPDRARAPGDTYDVHTYRRAIARAVALVNKRRADGAATVPDWHPHQLRHSAATRLRKEVGLEAARVVLGHSRAAVTEIYAEVDHAKAREIMGKLG